MNVRGFYSGWGALLVSASLLGCSGAEWRQVEIDSAYRAPKALTITVVAPRVAQEASQALTDALVDELKSGGIAATVVPETNGSAEANLTIGKWDPGSRSLRWLLGWGAGQADIVVTVETATIGVEGTSHGWVKSGWFGGDADGAAAEVGRMIGRTIVTGKSDAAPRQPKTPHSSVARVGAY